MRTLLATVLLLGALGAPAQAGRWEGPWSLSGGAVALNDRGDGILAWHQHERILVRFWSAAAGFGPPERFAAPSASWAGPPQVAIGDDRRAVVMWESTRPISDPCAFRCDYETDVWVATARDGIFSPPRLLARRNPPLYSQFTQRMSASRAGRAVVAWTDDAGMGRAGAYLTDPFDTSRAGPARLPLDDLADIAISGQGEIVASDGRRVITCAPLSLLCETAFELPSDGVRALAASASGWLLAVSFEHGPRARVRAPGGAWSEPFPLSDAANATSAAVRTAAITDTGAASVTWTAYDNTWPRLYEAHWTDPAAIRVNVLSEPGRRVVAEAGRGVATSSAGDAAYSWVAAGPPTARLALRPRGAAAPGPVTTLTPPGASSGYAPDVALNARGDLLAVWGDWKDHLVTLKARWSTSRGTGATTTLAQVPVRRYSSQPRLTRGHFAQVDFQAPVSPSARGIVPVYITCISIHGRACAGTLTLRRRGTVIGRARFTIARNSYDAIPERVSVRLTRAIRRELARRHRITAVATAITTAPNGADPRSSARVHLRD